jgi:hypothetical protein
MYKTIDSVYIIDFDYNDAKKTSLSKQTMDFNFFYDFSDIKSYIILFDANL